MSRQISRMHIEQAMAKTNASASSGQWLELWNQLEAEMHRLCASDLIDRSEYGFDCQPGDSADLFSIEVEDGRVKLEVDVRGNVLVDVASLPAPLREKVERLLQQLSEGGVAA